MSDTDRVWELMEKVGICMLASWDGDEFSRAHNAACSAAWRP
jgi:hypothetical protein